MRFQRHGGKESKQRNFTIRVSRSVDLTPTSDSPSSSPNNPASCSPVGMSPSTSFNCLPGEDDDLSNAPFIYLTPGCNSPKSKTLNCPASHSLPILQVDPKKCIKNIPLGKDLKLKPNSAASPIISPTSGRMAMSIDSANFRKWSRNEMSGKISMNLPKLHRRRGRRTSTTDKSVVGAPNRVKSVSPNIPETIPEIKSEFNNSKEHLIEPQPFVAIEEHPKPILGKTKEISSPTISRKPPPTVLGLAVSTWIFYFLIGCILLLIGSFAFNDLAKVVPL